MGVIVTAVLVIGAILAAADVSPVARGAAVAVSSAWGVTRWILHAEADGRSPILPAVLDMALTVTVLLLIPLLGIPGLFVILLLTARLAAIRGFGPAVLIGMSAVVIVVIRAAFIDGLTADVWFLVAMFGATTLATAAIINRVVTQRDLATARLERIELALDQVASDVADEPQELLPALTRATTRLVHDAREARVLLGDDVASSPTALEAQRSARTVASTGHPVETAIPLETASTVIGVLVVTSDQPLADGDRLLLRLWANRTATAVLLDRSRQREADARLTLERAAGLRNELVARVSHDLKVPLATVVGAARTLVEHGDTLDHDQVVALHEMLDRNAARLQRWVDEMFEEAAQGRIRPLDLERRSLQQVVSDAVEASAEVLRAHDVALEVERGVIVLADDDAVLRVMTNLLSNAAKFSPTGTRIGVIAEVVDAEVVVTVQDEGPGVPDDQLEQIFEPWARRGRSDSVAGAGLGLSTVRSLVQRWGGEVWAESPDSQGARLRFTLPLLQVGTQRGRQKDVEITPTR